jgi:hypothetical protein
MSNGHTPSGRTQPGHLGSPRRSRSWFRQVNFHPRLLIQRDFLVCKDLRAAVATLIYPSTDTWLFLGLLLKGYSHSFHRMSSTTTIWHAIRCHHQLVRVDTTTNFSVELRTPWAPPSVVGVPHKRSVCLSGWFHIRCSGGNCR